MTITALPTPPSRQDPANFSARGDTFMAALPAFVTEANALASDVSTKQGQAATSETNASAHKDASAASAAESAASAAATALSLAAVSAAGGLTIAPVSSSSQAAVTGNLYVLQNAALTTVTLPAAPVAGNVVCVLPSNGRIDNVIARNGKQINGLAEDLTIDNASASVLLRYVDATSQWRII